jgi:undecaprenyl-diphosphatase
VTRRSPARGRARARARTRRTTAHAQKAERKPETRPEPRPEAGQVIGFGGFVALGFLLGLIVLYAFAWLADEVLAQETFSLDNAASAYLQQFSSPELTTVMWTISLMGNEVVWVFAAVLLALFSWQRRWGSALTVVVILGGEQLLNNVLKNLFQRTRPSPVVPGLFIAQQFSFPSGHAMTAMAFYCYVGYLSFRYVRGTWRILVVLILAILVILIGVSRIYLGVHYLSDVIAGYLAGFLWTDMVILGSQLLMRYPRRRVPHA